MIFTLLLFGMPLLATVRLRRPSDMGSSAALIPYLLLCLGLHLASTHPFPAT